MSISRSLELVNLYGQKSFAKNNTLKVRAKGATNGQKATEVESWFTELNLGVWNGWEWPLGHEWKEVNTSLVLDKVLEQCTNSIVNHSAYFHTIMWKKDNKEKIINS